MGLNFTLGKAAFNIFITSLPNTPEVERKIVKKNFRATEKNFLDYRLSWAFRVAQW